jgi:hypothetical protein
VVKENKGCDSAADPCNIKSMPFAVLNIMVG